MATAGVSGHLDPVFLAQVKLRKRQYDVCIDICTSLLEENPLDQVGTQPPPLRHSCGDRSLTTLLDSRPAHLTSTTLGGVAAQVPGSDRKELDRRHRDGGGRGC